MPYINKPEMILFDVGGTLFEDAKFSVMGGLAKLRLKAVNPEATDDDTLVKLWDEYHDEIGSDLRSVSGIKLDIPLSAILKYITMKAGLRFDISITELEELFDCYNSERKVIDGVVSLLEKLDSMGIRTAVISNNAMSGESLWLAINRWIPENKFEFILTSADLLFTKPDKSLFVVSANYAHLKTENCWYCGDGRVPDVDGAKNAGMSPVFLDRKSDVPLEWRTDGGRGEYLAVNHWSELEKYLSAL